MVDRVAFDGANLEGAKLVNAVITGEREGGSAAMLLPVALPGGRSQLSTASCCAMQHVLHACLVAPAQAHGGSLSMSDAHGGLPPCRHHLCGCQPDGRQL